MREAFEISTLSSPTYNMSMTLSNLTNNTKSIFIHQDLSRYYIQIGETDKNRQISHGFKTKKALKLIRNKQGCHLVTLACKSGD